VSRFALAIHGGAGNLRRERLAEADARAMRDAALAGLRAGSACLRDGGAALDAVETAVVELERHPILNAGVGSVLNSEGEVEMDAALMEGTTGRAGAVTCAQRVVHPIRAARAVLEQGRHVVLAGSAADAFAAEQGLELVEPPGLVTELRRSQLARARSRERVSLDHDEGHGTVGAVACDGQGHLAAATSTGGMTNQHPGRVGDTPIPGAGTWASDATCAVSGTGQGEAYLRTVFAHAIDASMRLAGLDLDAACRTALARIAELGSEGGCIAVDAKGHLALPFNTRGMIRGWLGQNGELHVALFADEDPGQIP
jgi:beta-aspartyl-peptidase (threonine type)